MTPQFLNAIQSHFNYWSQMYRLQLSNDAKVVSSKRKAFSRNLCVDAGLAITREHSMWAGKLLDASMMLTEPHCYNREKLLWALAEDAKRIAANAKAGRESASAAMWPLRKPAARFNQLKADGTPRKQRAKRAMRSTKDMLCKQELPAILTLEQEVLVPEVQPAQQLSKPNTSMFG